MIPTSEDPSHLSEVWYVEEVQYHLPVPGDELVWFGPVHLCGHELATGVHGILGGKVEPAKTLEKGVGLLGQTLGTALLMKIISSALNPICGFALNVGLT